MRIEWKACLTLACAVGLARADVATSIAALRGTGPGGKGNAQAASAWRELVGHGPAALVPALGAIDDEDPVSANWLRPALDAIVEKAGTERIPARELELFLEDRKGGRMARACALELIRKKDPATADAFLGKSIDDPSPEIRRQAIAMALDKVPADGADGISLWLHSRLVCGGADFCARSDRIWCQVRAGRQCENQRNNIDTQRRIEVEACLHH